MVSQPTTIRNSLQTNWSLTGRLTKTVTATVSEIVRFYDREQVLGNEWPKAVVVRKINAEADENLVTHPHFTEVRDVYEITCYYRVQDVQEITFSDAIEDIEDMGSEVMRILKLTYDPAAATGIFFITTSEWRREDLVEGNQIDLRRTMQYTVTKIRSETPQVFEGFKGVLSFGGHTYAEVYNTETSYGSDQIAEPITDNIGTNLNKIPIYFTGQFDGSFNADMFISTLDISAASSFGINTIGDHEAQGEVLESTFLQTYNNTVGTPETLTISTLLRITRAIPVAFIEELVKFRLSATITRYPTMVIS